MRNHLFFCIFLFFFMLAADILGTHIARPALTLSLLTCRVCIVCRIALNMRRAIPFHTSSTSTEVYEPGATPPTYSLCARFTNNNNKNNSLQAVAARDFMLKPSSHAPVRPLYIWLGGLRATFFLSLLFCWALCFYSAVYILCGSNQTQFRYNVLYISKDPITCFLCLQNV